MSLRCIVCILEHGEGRLSRVSKADTVVNGHSVCRAHLEMVLKPEWAGQFYRPEATK